MRQGKRGKEKSEKGKEKGEREKEKGKERKKGRGNKMNTGKVEDR